MTADVVSGVARKIHEACPETTIYKDRIPQGLDMPCFFVRTTQVSTAREVSDRRRYSVPIVVQFVPAPDDYELSYDVADTLSAALELIPFKGGYKRGTDRHADVQSDGTLVCAVRYEVFAEDVNTETTMETFETEVNIYG